MSTAIHTGEFASVRTANMVNAACLRAIAAGHELDALNDEWRALCRRIKTLDETSRDYYDACDEEQRVTGRIVQLQRQLGVEVPV